MTLHLPLLLATGREDRQSEHVARFALQQIQQLDDVRTEMVDVRNYVTSHTTPPWQPGGQDVSWSSHMADADGLVIVSPEYNHGYPGEFKIVFDQLSSKQVARKPVAIIGVSSGNLGGARAVEQLRLVALGQSMVPTGRATYFRQVQDLFDESGALKAEHQAEYTKSLQGLLEELLWYAKALKTAREQEA